MVCRLRRHRIGSKHYIHPCSRVVVLGVLGFFDPVPKNIEKLLSFRWKICLLQRGCSTGCTSPCWSCGPVWGLNGYYLFCVFFRTSICICEQLNDRQYKCLSVLLQKLLDLFNPRVVLNVERYIDFAFRLFLKGISITSHLEGYP